MNSEEISNVLIQPTREQASMFLNEAAKATSVAVGIAVARYVYEAWTKPVPFSNYDQKRYTDLVRVFCQHRNDPVPEKWALNDESAPKYKEDLLKSASNLSSQLQMISTEHISITQSAMGMLETIIRLYRSISDRFVGTLREGNIEGMFFSELAIWIVSVLPQLTFKEKSGLDELMRVKSYLDAIKTSTILVQENNSYDKSRNNPTDALCDIITDLDGIIEKTKELIQAAGFNQHVEVLQNSALGMVANSLHIMYLLIKGEHSKEPHFPIVRFLDKHPSEKIEGIKNKLLGKWLHEFLLLTRIERSDFIAKNTPTLENAEWFLEGRCVGDLVSNLKKEHLDPTHSDWGLWPSLYKTDDSSKQNQSHAQLLLKLNRQVYREILYTLHTIVLLGYAAKASPVFGEDWMYGDKMGHLTIEGLLSITRKSVTDLNDSIQKLWINDCANTFARRKKVSHQPTMKALL